MIFTIFRTVVFGIGLFCLLVDSGNRLFGSYARRPLSQLLRISIAVFAGVVYSIPFLATIVMPDSMVLNTLIFVLGVSTIAFFLFPLHYGIKSRKHLAKNNTSHDYDLTPSTVLHEETVQIDETMLINNLSLFVLSDLHCNSQRQLNVLKESLDKLKTFKIDLLLILGDLTEDEKYLDALFKLCSEIHTEHGKFLVRGNHDYEGGRSDLIEELAQSVSVTLLSNKSYYIEKIDLTLIGTESPWHKTGITLKTSGLSIGLSHTPDNIKCFSRQKVPIVLAGHTHGGKIYIPVVGSILVPSLYGRFLDYGWFRYHETSMFITKGFGYFPGISGRKGEILKLMITKSKADNSSPGTVIS